MNLVRSFSKQTKKAFKKKQASFALHLIYAVQHYETYEILKTFNLLLSYRLNSFLESTDLKLNAHKKK